MPAVGHHDEARFLAVEELLDDDARAGAPSVLPASIASIGVVRFVERRGDDHALAGGEAVGLDDDRRAARVDVRVRGRRASVNVA